MAAETDDLVLLTACELPDRRLIIAAQEKGVDIRQEPHTVLVVRSPDGSLSEGGAFPRLTVDMCVNETGDGVVLIDPHGNVSDYAATKVDRSTVFSPKARAPHQLRFLKNISGTLYAGGTNGYLHRRGPARKWKEFSSDAMRPDTDDPLGFEDLDGFGPKELYAVGWNGALWTYKGRGWAEVDSPTDLILTSVATAGDRVFAGGQVGTIVEGRGTKWRRCAHGETDADIWSVATYRGAAYFATERVILKWEDGKLGVGHHIDKTVRTAYDLSVGPSGLWSIGPNDLVLFDGKRWRSMLRT